MRCNLCICGWCTGRWASDAALHAGLSFVASGVLRSTAETDFTLCASGTVHLQCLLPCRCPQLLGRSPLVTSRRLCWFGGAPFGCRASTGYTAASTASQESDTVQSSVVHFTITLYHYCYYSNRTQPSMRLHRQQQQRVDTNGPDGQHHNTQFRRQCPGAGLDHNQRRRTDTIDSPYDQHSDV